MEEGRSTFDAVIPLLKLVNEREDLFFQLLSFVNQNIESSFNDFDITTVFNQFLPPLKLAHSTLRDRQHQLLQQLEEFCEEKPLHEKVTKDVIHLSNRVYERLQQSLTRVRKGIFDQGGRSATDLIRFKAKFHNILKKEPFIASDYSSCVIAYTNSKFTRQLAKVQKYIEKVSQGQNISLRDLYVKSSDVEGSSPEDKQKQRTLSKFKRPTLNLKVEGKSHISEQKKPKRNLKSSVKKRQKLQSTRHKPKDQSQSEEQKPTKQQTANKLLKFYEALALSRPEFVQDYVFKEEERQRHKAQLLNRLRKRNKAVSTQISNYYKWTANHESSLSVINLPIQVANYSRSSGEQHNDSLKPKASENRIFRINKRRGSLHFESSSGAEKNSDYERDLPNSFTKREDHRKSMNSQPRQPRPQEKSRKLVVVKQQRVFDDELIPQAQINQPHFLQLPASLRKDRRIDLRQKKRNQPSPLQTAGFTEQFPYHS